MDEKRGKRERVRKREREMSVSKFDIITKVGNK